MDAPQFEQLLSRWTGGDRLAPAEEQALLDWLKSDSEARQALFQDEAVDSLLRSWSRPDNTGEEFVQGCLRRLAAVTVPPVVAPPIAAPPVARFAGRADSYYKSYESHKSHSDPRRRRSIAGWFTAAAGCAALALVVIGGRWLLNGPPPDNSMPIAAHGSESQPEPVHQEPSHMEPGGAFATLAQTNAAVWDTPRAVGDRLAAGVLKLTSGTAELHFDQGTVARLVGPAVLELHSGSEVFLACGSISAKVPPQAIGFSVETPLSRVVDLGTEFDVTVEDSGATQTVLRRGRVTVGPQGDDEEPSGLPIELALGLLDHATVSVPDIEGPIVPVMTVATGSQGLFFGRLSAGGKVAEFHSPAAYHSFCDAVLKQLHESPEQFDRKWHELLAGATAPVVHNVPSPPVIPVAPKPELGNQTQVATAQPVTAQPEASLPASGTPKRNVLKTLRQAHQLLSEADRDYAGHRVCAAEQVEKAIGEFEVASHGNRAAPGPASSASHKPARPDPATGRENEAISNAQMRQALQLLRRTLKPLAAKHPKAAADVKTAIQEIIAALAVK